MAMTQWSKEYEIGINSIDKDHQHLFKMVIDLGKQIEDNKAEDRIEATIRSLMLYVDEHFEREERFMKRAGYPNYEEHKKLHDQFRDSINSLAEFQKDNAKDVDANKIVSFLQEWLLHHIIKVDMAYKPYLNGDKQGIRAMDTDNQSIQMVNVQFDPEIYDKVQDFIKLISENTEEGILIETAVEKITENQIKRRKQKAKELFGK